MYYQLGSSQRVQICYQRMLNFCCNKCCSYLLYVQWFRMLNTDLLVFGFSPILQLLDVIGHMSRDGVGSVPFYFVQEFLSPKCITLIFGYLYPPVT